MTKPVYTFAAAAAEIPSAPRKASPAIHAMLLSFQGRFRVLLGLGLGLLPVGILTFFIVGQGLWEDLSIDRGAVVIQGTLYNPDPSAPLPIKPPHPFCLFYDYQYEGQAYRGESCVMDLTLASHSDKTLLQPGEAISLEIAAAAPAYSRVKGAKKAYLGYGGALLGLFPLLALVLIFSSLLGYRRLRAAFAYGTPIAATITDRRGENGLDGKPVVRLFWSFDANGKTYTGSQVLPEIETLHPLFRQEQVWLLHLPASPSAHVLYLGEAS